MERERMAREKEEAAMAASMQNRQKKLLNDLAEEEAKREDAVRSLQQMKDKEKEGAQRDTQGTGAGLVRTHSDTQTSSLKFTLQLTPATVGTFLA